MSHVLRGDLEVSIQNQVERGTYITFQLLLKRSIIDVHNPIQHGIKYPGWVFLLSAGHN